MKKSHLLYLLFLITITACTSAEGDAPADLVPTSPPSAVPTDAPTARPTPEPTPRQVLYPSQSYGGQRDQKVDIYLPQKGEGPFPVIVAYHGGGFRGGPGAVTRSDYAPLARHLTEKGFAFAAVDYRLTPRYTYPEIVQDVFCSLAWVHANGRDYELDTTRVVVWGGSAGGYLAAMLATVENSALFMEGCDSAWPAGEAIQAAVIFYGFYDFAGPEDSILNAEHFWGASYDDLSPEQLSEMSPLRWVDGSEPPIFIVHGVEDDQVPSLMSEEFAIALTDVGVTVELLLLPDTGHYFEIAPLDDSALTQTLAAIDAFLAAIIWE